MYTLTSSNCFENPLRLVVSCCVVFSMSGSSWFGLLSWAKWGQLLRDPNWEANPQNHGKNSTNLWWICLFSKSVFFHFCVEKTTGFFILCSLFRSPILKIILIKSVCFPNLENLFLHQSSPTKSPTRWWCYFYFFTTTWRDDEIWRAYLSIASKTSTKMVLNWCFFCPGGLGFVGSPKMNPGLLLSGLPRIPKHRASASNHQFWIFEVHALAFKHEFLGWTGCWLVRGVWPWFYMGGS